jgi:IMP dehydrogenase/GMP reductase
MTDVVRVFINNAGVDVPAGSTALDAVRAWNNAEASALAGGLRVLTDSRGLPTDAATLVSAGSIFRVLPARQSTRVD